MAIPLPPIGLLALIFLIPAIAAGGHSNFAKLDRIRIQYLSFGSGEEAIVFIHGWTCDSTFWKAQASIYENRRSLLIDLPGHGLSDKPDIPYTMELFAKAVAAVMTDAKVRQAVLVGHSMGAPVAIQFLREHPEQVTGVVIVDGIIPQPPKDEAERRAQQERRAGLVKAYRSPEYKNSAKQTLNFMFTNQTDPALREEIERKMLAAPQFVMASAVDGMMSMEPLTGKYPKLPVMAVMVKRSNGSQYRNFLEEHFPLITYSELNDAGHFLMLEQPGEFNKLLQEFLDHK